MEKKYYFQNPAKYILDFQITITTSHIRFYNFIIKYILGCFTGLIWNCKSGSVPYTWLLCYYNVSFEMETSWVLWFRVHHCLHGICSLTNFWYFFQNIKVSDLNQLCLTQSSLKPLKKILIDFSMLGNSDI